MKLRELEATLPTLATKADILELRREINRCLLNGTLLIMLAIIMAAFVIAILHA